MKDVFTTIQAELKKKVPALKTVTRWNNQINREGQMKAPAYPACFYQLTGVRTSTISTGIQHGEGTLRLRFCDGGLDVEKLKTYDVEAAAYLVLQGFRGGPLLVGLERAGAEPDTDTDAVEVLVVDYRIKYEDRARLNATRMVRPTAVATSIAP